MFSRRLEIAPDCSGRTERINHSEPGIAWHGRRMGQRHGAMAVSGRRGDHVGGRSGHAFAAGARLEKGQYLSFARQLHWRGTALGRRARGKKRLNAVRFVVDGNFAGLSTRLDGLDTRPSLAHVARTTEIKLSRSFQWPRTQDKN